jgi:hypothetical protein
LTCRIVCRVRVARMVRSTPVRAAQDTEGLAVLLPDGLPGPGRELMASLTVLSAKVAARAEGIAESEYLDRIIRLWTDGPRLYGLVMAAQPGGRV